MVAEGSFAEANPVIEDVHCRMRRIDVKKQARLPSTSSYTYWQIEKQVDSRRGDIISWGERIRLKHLPTKRYLAVIKDKEKWKVNTNTVEQ
jgi:inositol 1,4,5-triphosphate receptor type 1